MTTLATIPDLEQTQLDYFDALHDQADDDYHGGDPLTSIAFDVHKHQRSIETLEEASRAFCEDILTMKQQLHQIDASITALEVNEAFNVPEELPF